MRTSDILIKCVDQDTLPPPSVLADYLGLKIDVGLKEPEE